MQTYHLRYDDKCQLYFRDDFQSYMFAKNHNISWYYKGLCTLSVEYYKGLCTLSVVAEWCRQVRICASTFPISLITMNRGRRRTRPDMSCGKCTQSDSAMDRTGTVQMPIWCTRWGAHWRHLENMTELSVCGSDAALSNYFHHLLKMYSLE